MRRDFTYIDDIVSGTVRAIERPVPYDVFNLGNSDSVGLMDFIRVIEEKLGQEDYFLFAALSLGAVIITETSGNPPEGLSPTDEPFSCRWAACPAPSEKCAAEECRSWPKARPG